MSEKAKFPCCAKTKLKQIPTVRKSQQKTAPFTLYVRIHGASNLMPKDISASSDPFVTVSLDGNTVKQTGTISHDLNPVWDENFTIPLQSSYDESEVVIGVWNEFKFGKMNSRLKNVGKNAFLGQVVLKLSDVVLHNEGEDAVPYTKYKLEQRSSKSNVRGSITMCVFISRDSNEEQTKKQRILGRKKSHYSISELRHFTKYNEVAHEGTNYRLFLEFVSMKEVPLVSQSRRSHLHVAFKASSKLGKSSTKQFTIPYVEELNDDHLVDLESEMICLPVGVGEDVTSSRPVRLTLSYYNMVKVPVLLGEAKIHIDRVPVMAGVDENVDVPPIEMYLDRKTTQYLPQKTKLESKRTVCRLRFRAWLVEMEEGDLAEEGDDVDSQSISSMESTGLGSNMFTNVSTEESIMNTPRPTLPEKLKWDICNVVYNESPHNMNWLLFDPNSPLISRMCKKRNLSETSFPPWTEGEDGTLERVVKYVIPKTRIVKANHATENQKYTVRCKDALVVDIVTHTPEVPMGSTFTTLVRIFLIGEGAQKTRMIVTGDVDFSKSTWMKGAISNGAKNGMKDTYDVFCSVASTLLKGVNKPTAKNHLSDIAEEIEEEVAAVASNFNFKALKEKLKKNPQQIIIAALIIIILILIFLLVSFLNTITMLKSKLDL